MVGLQDVGSQMKYVIVDPAKKTVQTVNVDTFETAKAIVGLKMVDHGSLTKHLAYCVDEYGLYKDPRDQNYFSIGPILFAGGAVFYEVDDMGETINIKKEPPVMFYRDASQVEHAITLKQVIRPTVAVNGDVLWRWPQKKPDLSIVLKRMSEELAQGRAVKIDDTTIVVLDDKEK
jgi:hypothetical protein